MTKFVTSGKTTKVTANVINDIFICYMTGENHLS